MFPRRTMVVYSAHPDSMLVQIRQIRPTISGLELSISKTKERGKRRGQGLARSWVKRCRLLLFLEDWNQGMREEDSTMEFSAITLVLAGGMGFVFGTMVKEQHPGVALAQSSAAGQVPNDGKLRIIIFGAHPDYSSYQSRVYYMHRCKCGFYGDSTRECRCTPGQIQHYLGKI